MHVFGSLIFIGPAFIASETLGFWAEEAFLFLVLGSRGRAIGTRCVIGLPGDGRGDLWTNAEFSTCQIKNCR